MEAAICTHSALKNRDIKKQAEQTNFKSAEI